MTEKEIKERTTGFTRRAMVMPLHAEAGEFPAIMVASRMTLLAKNSKSKT